MDTKNTADRLHDIMALADAHAYAKIMPDTPREQRPYFFLRAEIQSLLAENEALRHKLQTLDELGAAGDDVQLLRMGYAAARLEIASLQGQLEAVGAGGVGPLMAAPAQPAAPEDSAVFDFWRADHMPQSDKSEAWAEWCALRSTRLAPQPAAQVQEDAGGWMRDGGMLYRLTDERRPTNFDEIRVTMANGSRDTGQLSAQAERLLVMLAAPQPAAQAQEEAVAQAVAAEREACAQVCITQAVSGEASWREQNPKLRDLVSEAYQQSAIMAQQGCAAAIRARGTDAAKPAAQAQPVCHPPKSWNKRGQDAYRRGWEERGNSMIDPAERYLEGCRDGYAQRDAEVRGALA